MFRADNKMLGCKLCFNFGLMFLLFHIADGVQVAGQYYVSKNTSTWMQASRQCSLATPSVDTFAADIPINLITEDLWVGYYLKHKAFEYIGCITTNGYSAKLSNIDMNLRICQSACGDVMDIGINKKACYCLNTKPTKDIHQSGCLDTCGGKSTVCGGKGYMSLYKSVKDSNISTDNPELCLKYENNEGDKYFVWDNCDKSFKTICSYGNGTVRLLNDNSLPWEKSVQGCLQTHGLPTSLSSSRSVVEVTGPVWTGIIKSLVIYKLDDMPVLTGNKTQDNGMTKDIGLIVGITVPLVLVVTAAVVVLVVLIRRGRVPYICKRKGSTSSEYVNTNTSVPDKSTPRAHINQAYDQFDKTVQKEHVDCGQETQKDDTSYAHDYFVLEKEMSYPEDSTYDSTVNGPSAAERENVNVYNTIESGATYDFTFHRGLNKEQGISNKYDSLENTITGSSSYKTTYQPFSSNMPVLTGNKTQDNGMTKDIGLIVGITVPLVLVVTAAVVVLVVLIRRGRVPYICKRKGSTSSEYVNTNTSVPDKSTPRAHINQAYDQFDKTVQKEHVDCGQETQKDDTSYAHDYFVLEKEMSYPEDSTYDSTVNGPSAAERENVNVYNTIESGATYDFTFHRGLNKEQGISNKYDSLENTITGSSSYKTTYQPYDDTYNHTKGMQKVKNVKTDNIYGTQMPNVDLNDTSDQDTYNHLNSKPNVKPDQIYGIPEK